MQPTDTDAPSLAVLNERITGCLCCPRLVEYRQRIGEIQRRAYRGETYWSRPVPGFGDSRAQLLIVGLAPGAHGSNRTGRMFTGDKSGEFLYRALWQTGFASRPESVSTEDGLFLTRAYITAAVRCVPPDNKPTLDEILTCRPYLEKELNLLPNVKVVVALGGIALNAYLSLLQDGGRITSRARFPFGHGAEFSTHPGGPRLLASYHPSQQNTSTKKLTAEMLRQIFVRARGFVAEAEGNSA